MGRRIRYIFQKRNNTVAYIYTCSHLGHYMTIKKSIDALTEEELLDTRICDLPLTFAHTWIHDCVDQLYLELAHKGLEFRPDIYIADEWLTPDKEPTIGIPFYLVHPNLIKLEKKMMYDAEGSTKTSCMRLLRHEAGHAINYAYRLYRRKRWSQVFGSMNDEYNDCYRFQAYSKNYVHHLEDYYAQCHPDEDFAETFAVWLTPHSNWEKEYRGWGAYEKLSFVDQLMNSLRGVEPAIVRGKRYWEASKKKITLKNFYKKKRKYFAEDFPEFHDQYLLEIFLEFHNTDYADSTSARTTDIPLAIRFLSKHKDHLIRNIAHRTGEKKYIIRDVFKSIRDRCRDLRLVCSESEELTLMKLSIYMTTIIMNKLYTGKFRGE